MPPVTPLVRCVREGRKRGRYLRQQPRNAPEIPEGSTLPDRGEGIMTMSEYEERFRSSTLSLHHTFAEARGPNRDDCRVDPSGSLQPWSV